MIKINLETLRIPKNLVLIKPDPDFEFIVIKPESEFSAINEPQKIFIGYDNETMARHYGVTGKVIKLPETHLFLGDDIDDFIEHIGLSRSRTDSDKLAELRHDSLNFDAVNELVEGDKVWFDYLCQLGVFEEKLIIDVEGIGLCFFVKYDRLYSFERDKDINPINGWVWIERNVSQKNLGYGLEYVPNDKNSFEPKRAKVLKASKAIKQYLDDDYVEDQIDLKPGDELLYDDRFGHEAEYEIHRTISDKEVLSVRRKNIFAVL